MMDKTDRKYTNGEITVFWKPKLCIHATTCYRELIEVFNPRKRPWVDMEGAPTEEIIRVVKLCPTKALAYEYNNPQEPLEPVEAENKTENIPEIEGEVRIMEDGPIILKGNFKVYDTNGTELKPMKMVSLCRCGASHDLPFCDGTHRKIGFTGK